MKRTLKMIAVCIGCLAIFSATSPNLLAALPLVVLEDDFS